MQVLFTSDLHLGHRNIVKYRDGFLSVKEHDDYMIDLICSLSKKTVLKVLGDFLFDCDQYEEYIQRLSKKACRIEVVMGNHDSLKLYKESIFDIQLPIYTYKNMWLSHCPIFKGEMRGRIGNIHGHLHNETIPDDQYFNVNIDVNKYQFVPLEIIKESFNQDLRISTL